MRVIRDGKVYLRKQCPSHGQSEALISGDVDWFLKSLTYIKEGSIPLQTSTEVKHGCPDDCGLCPDHEQHSCLPIIEITNHCNLECPICIVQNRHNYSMTKEEFGNILDGLIKKEGVLETINLSGGEPTMHPDFLEFLDMARARKEISRVSISTNGLRVATDYAFCEELAKRKVYVSLQLDALSNPALRVLRGGGDQRAAKDRALANLEKAGVRTTIVSTVAKGINDDHIGECIKLLYERDFILSLTFQPAAYTGYGGDHFAPHNPMDVITIPDVVRAAEEQTGGALDGQGLPAAALLAPELLRPHLPAQDRGRLHALPPLPRAGPLPGDHLQPRHHPPRRAVRGRHPRHHRRDVDQRRPGARRRRRSSAASSARIHLMYPEDRALELEERLQIGEGLVKTVFIHAFMDVHTFEVDRIKKCCTHYALPDGRLMPGCAYNLLYRDRDERYTGPVGEAKIWGAAEPSKA